MGLLVSYQVFVQRGEEDRVPVRRVMKEKSSCCLSCHRKTLIQLKNRDHLILKSLFFHRIQNKFKHSVTGHHLPSSVTRFTTTSFQGRESDIIIFSTVRCNVEGGFLDDPRRLNVMWTRARLALIIAGDRKTRSGNPFGSMHWMPAQR